MKPGSIAAAAAGAVLALGLAACSSGGSSSSTPKAAPPSTAPAAPSSSAATGSGGLTAPGTHLGFGQVATVGWIPPALALNPGTHKALTFKVTVQSIETGTIADFKNVDLNAKQKKETPYYVKVMVTAASNTTWKGDDDPAISFRAIDDRGQEQGSLTFFGDFPRCNEVNAPKPFTSGKSYQSCFAYLLPSGASIKNVEWNDGPTPANGVSVYFDKPIVWASS
ncbi:MAG TPA: hypothetical protein VGM14_22505 [Streptosporangiaceae bacterium]|jgi:hypothetical protein